MSAGMISPAAVMPAPAVTAPMASAAAGVSRGIAEEQCAKQGDSGEYLMHGRTPKGKTPLNECRGPREVNDAGCSSIGRFPAASRGSQTALAPVVAVMPIRQPPL